ncbi:MAG: RluA family pseudouridine synthase [Saprospiraceae bacterium]
MIFSIKDGILLSNHHFIAFNKPAGMAVQSFQNKEESLEVKLQQYCKVPLHLIHRIDQPCSGIVLFAKKKITAASLHEQMNTHSIHRLYLAIVLNKPERETGILQHYIFAHKKSNKSFIVDEHHKEGKEAQLEYHWLGPCGNDLHLLQINLDTGRHHQIRAQLGAIHCPISGDVKYGAKQAHEDRSIGLHAWKMDFDHPIDKKLIQLVAALPDSNYWVDSKNILDK